MSCHKSITKQKCIAVAVPCTTVYIPSFTTNNCKHLFKVYVIYIYGTRCNCNNNHYHTVEGTSESLELKTKSYKTVYCPSLTHLLHILWGRGDDDDESVSKVCLEGSECWLVCCYTDTEYTLFLDFFQHGFSVLLPVASETLSTIPTSLLVLWQTFLRPL